MNSYKPRMQGIEGGPVRRLPPRRRGNTEPSSHKVTTFLAIFSLLCEKTVKIITQTHHLPPLLLLVLFAQHTSSEGSCRRILDAIFTGTRGGGGFLHLRTITGRIGRALGGSMLLALLRAGCFLQRMGETLLSKLRTTGNKALLILIFGRQDHDNVVFSVRFVALVKHVSNKSHFPV